MLARSLALACAAVLVTAPTALAEEVDVFAQPANPLSGGLAVYQTYDIAQQFKATHSGTITSVSVGVYEEDGASDGLTVALHEASDDGRVGNVITSRKLSQDEVADAPSTGAHVVFRSAPRVVRGRSYAIVLSARTLSAGIDGEKGWYRWRSAAGDDATAFMSTYYAHPSGPRWNDPLRFDQAMTVRVARDTTDPVVRITLPADGQEIPRNASVTPDYGCDDDFGVIASCEVTAPVDTTTLGHKTFEVTATDAEGNSSTGSAAYKVVDVTRPTIAVASPAAGAVYEAGSEQVADFDCVDDDGGSGIASCDGDVPDGQPIDTSVGEKNFTVTAVDKEGNRQSAVISYKVVDTTPPTVDVAAPVEGTPYKRGEQQTADFDCVDNKGGSGIASCVGTVKDGEAFDTRTLGDKTFVVTATDVSGNEHTVEVAYSVVDRTAPTIEPESGQQFLIGSDGVLTPSCADEELGSGLKSCVAGAIDTSVVGFHTVTVRAEDNAGNVTEAPVRYQVIWPFGGFYSPVNMGDTLNVAKAGSAIPVKFSLGGDRGTAVLDATPSSRQIACEGGAEVDTIEETTASAAGLTYDAASQRYQYVWKTARDSAGTCRKLSVQLADGTTHTALFRLK